MNIISISLENCYGIKKLDAKFKFDKAKANLIYAGNGVMKSSLAKVFTDLSIPNQKPKDNFFTARIAKCSLLDENNHKISPESIFVIHPPQKKYHCKTISRLLVNETLKDRYDELNQTFLDDLEKTLLAIKKTSKFKGDLLTEINEAFEWETSDYVELFDSLINEISNNENFGLDEISYIEIFNPAVIKFLQTSNFQKEIIEYIAKFNELISKCNYFKPEFNHFQASQVTTSLRNNNFFDAKNQILLHKKNVLNDERILVTSLEDLEILIETEKRKILDNPELIDRFSRIEEALDSNKELRKFGNFLNNNQHVVLALLDLDTLKKKLWISYGYVHKESIVELIKLGKLSKKEIDKIIEEAKAQNTRWKEVVDKFNKRFSLPYKLEVVNLHKVLLNNAEPALKLTYIDGTEQQPVSEEVLVENLSTGERKAWFLLNIIFEIETRINEGKESLLIIDDIADSFDYKNKFAIIEYLKEIVDTNLFYTIFLTHNFDFFRTVSRRLNIHRTQCWMPIKTIEKIELVEAAYFEEPLKYWRDHFKTDKKIFIAMITMVRNLIEYSQGTKNNYYNLLTSLLHIKPDTFKVSANNVIDCFNQVLPNSEKIIDDYLIVSEIFRIAKDINKENKSEINLVNKIILSIAIRLHAEIFIKKVITDGENIFFDKDQTRELISIYKNTFSTMKTQIEILDRVNLVTPENIHLNSFMYEPLLDIADEHLKELLTDTSNLNHKI